MATNATKKAVTFLPALGSWHLEVLSDSSQLRELNSLDIGFEVAGENRTRLFGSVNSAPPLETAFAMNDGQVTDAGVVAFDLTINGTVFSFTATLENDKNMIKGRITPSTLPKLDGKQKGTGKTTRRGCVTDDEEGSWSAQAQGGPVDKRK